MIQLTLRHIHTGQMLYIDCADDNEAIAGVLNEYPDYSIELIASMTDQWEMWAAETEYGFEHIGTDPRYVRAYDAEPVPVVVTLDPAGEYWGWLAASYPSMIYRREVLFRVCFPYGPEEAEKAGKGRVVKLNIGKKNTQT
jgi:hypothetical protein